MEIKELSKKMRIHAIEMAHNAGKKGAHLGGGLSAIEIFSTLYGAILKEGDQVVVSKGHCVLAYYTALYEFGFLTDGDIQSFETNGGLLHGHPTRNKAKNIEFSAGSLGMGLSFAVGIALAKLRKNDQSKVYCIVGDGECNEGSIWEAVMSASKYKLSNLIIIVDKNGLQYDGPTEQIMNLDPLTARFEAFGFEARDVNGHDEQELHNAFISFSKKSMPKVLIANTIKGKGVSFIENKPKWHFGIVDDVFYQKAMEELR